MVSVLPANYEPTTEDAVGVLTILSGAKMPVLKAVKNACQWYEQYVVEMTHGN